MASGRQLTSWVVVLTLILAYRSAAQMSQTSKDQVNNGMVTGEKVVGFISKLGDPKVHNVFDSLGKMAGFLGAAGGLVSFIMIFLPEQESAELQFMRKKFSEVNMKLDGITRELDTIKDLIKYENQRAVYIKSASNILHGHVRLLAFIDEVQKTPCSGKSECNRVRTGIADRFAPDLDVRQSLVTILNGATKTTSFFGDPILQLIRDTYECDIGKLDHFSNGILKLAFKAQQVILAHEKLTGSKFSITQSMNDWLKQIYHLRDYTTQQRKYCFDNIKTFMIADINVVKYQVGVSTNDQANKALKTFLEKKYPWLGWVVHSYGAYGGHNHYVQHNYGKFWSMPTNKDDRKRNIIVNPIDKTGTYDTQKAKVKKALDELANTHNFTNTMPTLEKCLSSLILELQKKGVFKYVTTINVLHKYTDLQYQAAHGNTILIGSWIFKGWVMKYNRKISQKNWNVKLVIGLKSKELADPSSCTLGCNGHGQCLFPPYSSAKYCQCKSYYQGDDCGDSTKAQLAKTMDAMLQTTLTVPYLSDISFDIKDLREYVGISFGMIQTAISKVEKSLTKAFDGLTSKLNSQFQWANLITHYANEIQRVKFFAHRFENLPNEFPNSLQAEGKKLAEMVLRPDGIQKIMYEINFLLIGRTGTPLANHQPLLFLYMQKHSNLACTTIYKAAVDNTWRQLILLQQNGYNVWAQALDFVGKSTAEVDELYKTRVTAQVAKMKEATCPYIIPNSENINCAGGFYLHPGMTVNNKCKANYYITGSIQTTCQSKTSGCDACNCHSTGSNVRECADLSGKCGCNAGFFGTKCSSHHCIWNVWGGFGSCSAACGYGGTKTRHRSYKVAKLGQGNACPGSSSSSASCFNGCCSNQYHCSNRKKCISAAHKCDYNNDCGDRQDENSCHTRCTTRYTRWNTNGSGKVEYLDRHRMNCGGEGNVLRMFHLQRSGGNIRYQYTCCKLYNSVCSLKKKSNGFTYDGNGDTVYLDRQSVDCGQHGYLNDISLERDSGHDNLRYVYYCCNLKYSTHQSRTHCYTSYTSYSYDGDGTSYYLDRQTVQCSSGYYLSYFRLVRNSGHNYWRYHYRCCKIQV